MYFFFITIYFVLYCTFVLVNRDDPSFFFLLVEWCYLHPKKKASNLSLPHKHSPHLAPLQYTCERDWKILEQIFGSCSILAFQFSLCCWFGKNWTNYTYICILWYVLWKFSWKKKSADFLFGKVNVKLCLNIKTKHCGLPKKKKTTHVFKH